MKEITKQIIGSSFTVINTLGHGFLEKVYENALAYELELHELNIKQQQPINVHYKNKIVGQYIADMVVENCIIVELKATSGLITYHAAQVLNYLRATGYSTGLLINFGKPKLEFRKLSFEE